MTEKQLTILINKYLSGEASEAERKQVEQWYESFDVLNDQFLEGDTGKISESTARTFEFVKRQIADANELESRKDKIRSLPKPTLKSWGAAAAAAAILLLLASGIIYQLANRQQGQSRKTVANVIKSEINPGGNKAVLTLANGKKIILDSTNSGVLLTHGNTRVIKLGNGLLRYSPQQLDSNETGLSATKQTNIEYNTISTPRGGQYKVILPDGTKVWLNAASSLRFPTAFNGNYRTVQMTGEAYFEVTKNAHRPFNVKVRNMQVQVLGTHFNIRAYDDEASMQTTLLEGAVKVTSGNHKLMLKPGQGASVKPKGQIRLETHVNLDQAVAWKNNLFWFDDNDIETIMHDLSKWYNVDITTQGDIPYRFTGSIPRDLPFSKVFEILQKTGSIHYKIADKKIIVTP